MKSRVITSTEAARTFSELLNVVRYQGKSFDIKRGKEVVARIVPAGPTLSLGDLEAFLKGLPSLSDADSQAFEKDIKAIRGEMKLEDNPWD